MKEYFLSRVRVPICRHAAAGNRSLAAAAVNRKQASASSPSHQKERMVFLVIVGIFHQYIECHAPEDLAAIVFWRARKLSSRICKVRVSHVVHINALRDQKRAGACKVMARAIWSAIEAFDKKNVFSSYRH